MAISPEDYLVQYNAACTYAVIGRAATALDHLENVFARAPRARAWLLGIVQHDVQLDSLRAQPAFRAFVARLGAAAQEDRKTQQP